MVLGSRGLRVFVGFSVLQECGSRMRRSEGRLRAVELLSLPGAMAFRAEPAAKPSAITMSRAERSACLGADWRLWIAAGRVKCLEQGFLEYTVTYLAM